MYGVRWIFPPFVWRCCAYVGRSFMLEMALFRLMSRHFEIILFSSFCDKTLQVCLCFFSFSSKLFLRWKSVLFWRMSAKDIIIFYEWSRNLSYQHSIYLINYSLIYLSVWLFIYLFIIRTSKANEIQTEEFLETSESEASRGVRNMCWMLQEGAWGGDTTLSFALVFKRGGAGQTLANTDTCRSRRRHIWLTGKDTTDTPTVDWLASTNRHIHADLTDKDTGRHKGIRIVHIRKHRHIYGDLYKHSGKQQHSTLYTQRQTKTFCK